MGILGIIWMAAAGPAEHLITREEVARDKAANEVLRQRGEAKEQRLIAFGFGDLIFHALH